MTLFLTNGFVIDCASDDIAPVAATVAVEGGSIQAIYPAGVNPMPPPSPEDCVLDLAGRYLLPGLWDCHCHPGGMIPDPHRVSYFETVAELTLRAHRNTSAALLKGVTALRATGEADFVDIALREAYANRQPAGLWKKGYDDKRLLGPRMFCAGPGLRITGGHGAEGRVEPLYTNPFIEVDGPDAVSQAARYVMKMGADCVKLMITGGIAGIREGMGVTADALSELRASL